MKRTLKSKKSPKQKKSKKSNKCINKGGSNSNVKKNQSKFKAKEKVNDKNVI